MRHVQIGRKKPLKALPERELTEAAFLWDFAGELPEAKAWCGKGLGQRGVILGRIRRPRRDLNKRQHLGISRRLPSRSCRRWNAYQQGRAVQRSNTCWTPRPHHPASSVGSAQISHSALPPASARSPRTSTSHRAGHRQIAGPGSTNNRGASARSRRARPRGRGVLRQPIRGLNDAHGGNEGLSLPPTGTFIDSR
jgi:hypothetical protein